MNLQEYYNMFKATITSNIDESLKDTHPYNEYLGKNKAFCDEYEKWLNVLDGRIETYIYRNAIKAYQEAYVNMLMGLYQPAFMGLRYFLERTLMGVYFSASEIEMRTWKAGNRDTYWSELVEIEEKEGKQVNSGNDVNKGLSQLSLHVLSSRSSTPFASISYNRQRLCIVNVRSMFMATLGQ